MLRDVISKREKELPVSNIGKLLKIAEEKKDIISLGPGEPDFDSPPRIIKAAKRSLDRKETHYSPVSGRSDFKIEIAKKLRKENKIRAYPDNIIVTTGATEGILLSMLSCLDAGEGVLLPDPGFLSFKPTVEILNGIPISVPLEEDSDFCYDTEVMEDLIIPEKTKALILNTPANPTGGVYKKKKLEEIADFAVEHDLLIISDEAYEKLVYDDAKHVSIGSLIGMSDRVVTLHSFSKTFAMPGFRLGYAAGPPEIINAMKKLHVLTTLCAPTISQVTGMAALKSGKETEMMRKEYDKRRKYMYSRLIDMGIHCMEPKGTFYMFPAIHDFKMSSMKFCELLLKRERVAIVPGTEFGKHGEGYVRLSYATSLDKIKIAMDRIGKFISRL
jgi:aminotransferase